MLAIERDSDEYSSDYGYADGGDWHECDIERESGSTHAEDVWVNDY